MNTTDDGIVSDALAEEVERRFRWVRWTVLLLVLAILAAGALGWALRKSVAEQALAGWCEARELVCTGKFARLGTDGATLQDLKVSGQGEAALQAEKVDVSLDWPRLFTPRVRGISVTEPVVYGALSDGTLSFHGLERLARGGTNANAAAPELDITDGRILVATSAGQVTSSFSVTGRFPRDGHLALTVDPARLDEPQGRIEWSEGIVDIAAKDGLLQGDISLALESAETDEVAISQARLSASFDTLSDSGTQADAPVSLVWEGTIGSARAAGYALQAVETSGRAAVSRIASGSFEGMLRSLTALDIQLESGPVTGPDQSAAAASLEASLAASDGALRGPISFSLEEGVSAQGHVARLDVDGILHRDEAGALDFSGPVTLVSAGLSKSLADRVLQPIALPAPLSAHGESLKAAFREALADFGTTLDVQAQYGGGHMALALPSSARIEGASGLVLTIEPAAGADWLRLDTQGLSAAGAVTLSGGGAPQAQLRVDALSVSQGAVRLSARDIGIRPWTANGAAFGADLPALSLSASQGAFDATVNGRISVSGKVFGFQLAPSALTGGLQAVRSGDGWQVTPEGARCLRFETDGIGIGAIEFARNAIDFCPKGGDFVPTGRTDPGGQLLLGDLVLPFTARSVNGTLSLPDATLDWTSKGGLAFTLDAPTLSLPMNIGERTLAIDAARPQVTFASRKGTTPHLTAALGKAGFTGTLVPAIVTAGRITFDGTSNAGGLSGDIAGADVLVRDFRDDPMYQPLIADLTATLDQGQLVAQGPFRLQSNNVPIGTFGLDVNVMKLDGTAHVSTRPLDFRKGGLQPVMLSERLRGVYTDAVGRIEAVSDVTITDGRLDGTAGVTVSGFGFQTTRLGRVESVNGHVAFDDLFALRTEPAQILTIGGLNPGVPLRGGQITFAYASETGLDVSSASFPFSGGALALAPFQWVPRAETQRIEVTADAIDLATLVEIMKLPKIEAEGTVSGRFPIEFSGTKVLIRDAHLFADASGGRVAYLGDAADAAAQSNANVRLAFEALKDFDFTVLEVGLDGNVADRVKITLKLAGKSRKDIAYGGTAQVVRGQPFEFNIVVDSALAELFRSSQFYTNQQKITDFVVKEVLEDRGLTPAKDE
ncbi:MAG: YdbH domain-containing protein [Hyphomonas sp.]